MERNCGNACFRFCSHSHCQFFLPPLYIQFLFPFQSSWGFLLVIFPSSAAYLFFYSLFWPTIRERIINACQYWHSLRALLITIMLLLGEVSVPSQFGYRLLFINLLHWRLGKQTAHHPDSEYERLSKGHNQLWTYESKKYNISLSYISVVLSGHWRSDHWHFCHSLPTLSPSKTSHLSEFVLFSLCQNVVALCLYNLAIFFYQCRECYWNNNSNNNRRCHHRGYPVYQLVYVRYGFPGGRDPLVRSGWILQFKSEQGYTLFCMCVGKCFVLMCFNNDDKSSQIFIHGATINIGQHEALKKMISNAVKVQNQ